MSLRSKRLSNIETTVYTVSSVEEAVKLAMKFKKSGKYDVFRGQARNWPVLSSLHRDGSKNYKKNEDKWGRFLYFLSKKKELKSYLDNVHYPFAIAQHYGLATPYIDFTFNPEIAAFFATNSRKAKHCEKAEIICVNSKAFTNFVDFVKPVVFKDEIPAEFVTIDVGNLWRLQAQEGCFLFSPFGGIEHLYSFHRIEFPFTQKYDKIQHSKVFPHRKSSLEILLENYFRNEQSIEWSEFVQTKLPEVQRVSLPVKHNIFDYISPSTKTHGSWSDKKIS